MIFRTRYQLRGSHYHVRIFSAVRPDTTFAEIGELVMSEADWEAFKVAFQAEHKPEPI